MAPDEPRKRYTAAMKRRWWLWVWFALCGVPLLAYLQPTSVSWAFGAIEVGIAPGALTLKTHEEFRGPSMMGYADTTRSLHAWVPTAAGVVLGWLA